MLVCGLLVLVTTTLLAEGIGEWKNYTDMKSVRRATRSGISIWAATSGGMFRLAGDQTTFNQWRNSEGLRDNDLTSILVDEEGLIWTGTESGIVHAYDPEKTTWNYVTDIAISDKPSRRINALIASGDSILIATDFGLSVFSKYRFEFRDTFLKFGSFPSQSKVQTVILTKDRGEVWVGTPSGLAFASLASPNLSAPESWRVFTTAEGLQSNNVEAIGTIRSVPQSAQLSVVVGTDLGLAILTDSLSLAPFLSGSVGSQRIVDLHSSPASDRLTIGTPRQVYRYDMGGQVIQVGSATPFEITSVFTDAEDSTWVSMVNGGVARWDGSAWQQFFPNGPNSNLFTNILVTGGGSLWAGSGIDGSGRGFYKYDGKTWTNFGRTTNPELAFSDLPSFDDWYRVSKGCAGELWVSSWGRGLTRVDENQSVQVFNTQDGFIGIPVDPNFVVCGDVLCSRSGTIWTTVLDAANGKSIAVRGSDGAWSFLRLRVGGQTITTLTGRNVRNGFQVDPFGQMWLVAQDSRFSGLVYFTEVDTGNGEVDATGRTITVSDGLTSSTVTNIAFDRDGDLWVGADQGITIIAEPRSPKSPNAIAPFHPLREQYINTIAVDALNNKWVGTKEGVFYLSPDGTQIIGQLTVNNTEGKLIDNDVKSIAIDGSSGVVYFGTEHGLASLRTVAVEPSPSFLELSVAPNPYIIPSAGNLSIDGLVAEASIKILSVDGSVVHEFRSPGGRVAFWDGKNAEGRYVSTGVYFVVAASADGNDLATAKVAVVRHN